jgi:hypothetical protein
MDKYRIVSCACIVTTQPAFATVDGVDSACRNVNKNENAIEKREQLIWNGPKTTM